MNRTRRFLQDRSCVFAESFGDINYIRNKHTVRGAPGICDSPWGKAMVLDGINDDVTLNSVYEEPLRFDSGAQDFSVVLFTRPDSTDQYIMSKRMGFQTDGFYIRGVIME